MSFSYHLPFSPLLRCRFYTFSVFAELFVIWFEWWREDSRVTEPRGYLLLLCSAPRATDEEREGQRRQRSPPRRSATRMTCACLRYSQRRRGNIGGWRFTTYGGANAAVTRASRAFLISATLLDMFSSHRSEEGCQLVAAAPPEEQTHQHESRPWLPVSVITPRSSTMRMNRFTASALEQVSGRRPLSSRPAANLSLLWHRSPCTYARGKGEEK